MRESFGQHIKKLRNEKTYTITQLAAKLGIDSSALSKIENDKKAFDESLITKLSEIFNLSENDLKDEYYSEIIAKTLVDKQCSEKVLNMAADKAKYLREKKITQSKFNFQ
jgi:transcriptional regulator with XRE-family HTH domain